MLADPPVSPPVTTGAPQEYVVPAGTLPSVTSTGVTVKLRPLHTAAVNGLMAGLGLTVTVNVNVEPEQPPNPAGDAGVIV